MDAEQTQRPQPAEDHERQTRLEQRRPGRRLRRLKTLGDSLEDTLRQLGVITSRLLAADAALTPPPAVKPAAEVKPPRCSPEQVAVLVGLVQSLHASPAKVAAELARYDVQHMADLTPLKAADLERRLRQWLAAMKRGEKTS